MIVIPMAGLSSRFFNAGYTVPKYMLEAHGQSLFEWSVRSFEKYFESKTFIFVIRNVFETKEFVELKANKIGIRNYHIVTLDKETMGQAHTVEIAIKENIELFEENNKELTVFNIDTFSPGFSYPEFKDKCDGYLQVFRGEGDNWSFAKPKNNGQLSVSMTAEKKAISDLCSTGLYYFKNYNDFLNALDNFRTKPKDDWQSGELYIAPLYNYLIAANKEIKYDLVSDEKIKFCGVPSEFDQFLSLRSNDKFLYRYKC
ncbi:glycosyltransferase family 2 protein [Vibrio breoganii]|uniref:glycosyltransferase family 2 protein n=1 Tax=Vibrio breoganii TaxID=553239 RepID=UPI000302B0D5|nr:glycosyltransferase family 2 protein [Vibrio breoganii]OED96329.1 capsular biosynthesis protein [Vibrio breoganii ZF-29]TKG21070.1 capsular biosynthesis protein [Vibrio breoganii]